ncbi:hypothetical protein [Vibrio owensii]|uniref:hypothetical protein n=1 Tax=Vibrio harveyi group TaxID=717610 RepID=UPI003CC6B754
MSKEVAQIIQHQINVGKDEISNRNGKYLQICWGVTKRMFLESNGKHKGGLVLVVNGNFHKGEVHITLSGNDDYDIAFLKNGECVYRTEGIYDESLTRIIDSYVESNSMQHHKVAA